VTAAELLVEFDDAHIGSGHEAHHAEQYQSGVLPQPPVEAPVSGVLVVHGQLDRRRNDHAQRAEAHRSDQRDEGPQIGQGHGDSSAQNLKWK